MTINNSGMNSNQGGSIDITGDHAIESIESGKTTDEISAAGGTPFKEKVSDNLSAVAAKFHEGSDTVQEYLLEKTDQAGSYAHRAIDAANGLGHRTADTLDSSSGYVRNFDLAETKQRVIDAIKQKPEVGIAAAGIFGLLIGLVIGRSSK